MDENSHLPCFTQPEFSPMTEISINLSSTKISRTKKRRLSLKDADMDFDEKFTPRKCLQDITNVSTRSLIDSPSRHDGEISLYGGATPETRSPESSPEQRSKKGFRFNSDYFRRKSSADSGFGCSLSSQKFENDKFDFDISKDEFTSLEVDTLDDHEDAPLPINFNSLVSGNILFNTPKLETKYRTPPSKARNRLFASSPQTTPLTHNKENAIESVRTKEQTFKILKRSKSLFDNVETQQSKRHKFAEPTAGCSTPIKNPLFRRSISTCSPNTIMTAVHRSATEPDLIGDFSKPFILPLVPGRHQDLKSITCATLANLIKGHYTESVASYKVIDCRYPYEYNGGHIQGALNYYTKEQIESHLFNIKKDVPISQKSDSASSKREIVIFHCEFSAQRGPKLFRFLRTLDRNHNNDVYPALHYPEIYLLEGGYKRFFESYSDLCEPVAYKRMDDPEHEEECRQFRAQKRSCSVSGNSRKLVTKRSALEF